MDAPEMIADVSTAEAPEIELDPEVEPASETEQVPDSEQAPLNAVHGEELKNGGDEKKWPGWPGENVFRILVPAHKVGGIIGKKGECIKKMCEESKSRIKILDGPHAAARSSTERAVIISAKEEPDAEISPAMNGLLHVHKYIIDSLAGEATRGQVNPGNTVKTRLLAPGTQARSLIGKQGSTIKSIQEASSSTVRILEEVPAFALQDDRVIEIQGEPAGVHKAVELISGRLRIYLVDRSVLHLFESSMPMPNTPMENMAPPPQSWGHPHALPPNASSGFGAPPFMPQRPHDNYYPPPELPPMEKSHHGVSVYGREPPSMGVPSANQPPPVLSQVTHHMQIPLSFADAVIGTSGASISYIRRTSGATITIQETRGVPGEMTVEINGSGTQVQTAQQLIQNFMAEAAAPAQNVAPPVDQGYNFQSYGGYMSGPANAGPGSAGGGYGSGYGTNYGY